jgi:O-antigen ligase
VLAAVAAVAVVAATATVGKPLTALATVGFIAVAALVVLTLVSYDRMVTAGFVVFGVVLFQPALPDLIFAILILATFLRRQARVFVRRTPPLILYTLGAFFALNVLASAWAPLPGEAAFFLAITTFLILFGIWVAGYVDSSLHARRVLVALTVGAVVTGTIALVALFTPATGSSVLVYDHTRAKGFFDDPNVFGPFMIVPLALLLSEFAQPMLLNWRRKVLVSVMLLCAASVLFSYSRAAWLNAFLVVVTMISVFALRRGGAQLAAKLVGLGLAALAVLAIALVLTGSTSFFLSRAHSHQSYDTSRFNGQDQSFRLAMTHPFGIGPGQYIHYAGIAAHSTYLRALGEEGVLGLAVIALLVLATLVFAVGNVIHGRSTFGISSVALLGLWIGLIVNSIFVDTLHWRHLWFVAGLIWAGAMTPQTIAEQGEQMFRRSAAQSLARAARD